MENKQEKIEKLAKILNKAGSLEEGKEIALAVEFISLENKVESVNENINTKLSDVAQAIRDIPKTEIPEPKEFPAIPEFPKQIAITLPEGMTLKGDKGDSPIKGKDYFTSKEISQFKKEVTPVKGVDYFDGEPAEPIDVEQVVLEVLSNIPEIKDSSPDSGVEIVDKINDLPTDDETLKIDAKHIKNLPKSHGGGTVSQHFYQLQDVVFTDLQDNDIPVWNATDQRWENDTVAGASGIERNTAVVSTDTSMGASTKTDYVYLVSGLTTMTLPTAVGNTNRYTVKNVGSDDVTIATTGGQTIDGAATAVLTASLQGSVDLVGDNVNWFVC